MVLGTALATFKKTHVLTKMLKLFGRAGDPKANKHVKNSFLRKLLKLVALAGHPKATKTLESHTQRKTFKKKWPLRAAPKKILTFQKK